MGGTLALLFSHAALLCMFPLAENAALPSDPPRARLLCEHEEMTVQNGSDVVLRAHLDPRQDLSSFTLDVKVVDDNRDTVPDDIVFSYRNGYDHPEKPRKDSSNSSLSHADLRTGTITLELRSVHLPGRRNYKFYVPRLKASCYVTLRVGAEKKEDDSIVVAVVTSVVVVVAAVVTIIGCAVFANRRKFYP